MKHHVPNMPRPLIVRHPKALAMSNAAYGALSRILDHYWFTDCAPLPVNERQLFILARANRPTWKLHNAEILAVLQDVIPELTKAHAASRKRGSILGDLRDRAASAKRAKRLEKAINSQPSIASVYEPKIAERNRSPAPSLPAEASIKSGFVEKPRR